MSKKQCASAHERGLKPFGEIQFDVAVEERVFRLEQIERNAQVQYGGHKVAESQRAVFPHVPQYEYGQHLGVYLEAHLEQRVLEPFGFQDASLIFRMVLEHRLPIFQTAHQVLEIVELQPSAAGAL